LYDVQFDYVTMKGLDMTTSTREQHPLTGVAAGVPYVAFPPEGGARADVPVVVAWHLMDAPRTERAFAAAVPLAGLDAWRVYLGLPMTGARLPAGGYDELMQLGFADAVLHLQGPVTRQAVAEFPAACAELRTELGFGDGPLAVVGGSIGAAVAQLVALEAESSVRAAVLISPVVQLAPVVTALSKQFGVTYEWSDASRAVAARLDFVARADEFATCGAPAVLLVVGEHDDVDGIRAPAQRLHAALADRYADHDRVNVAVVPGMGHALAEEPGEDPAPQTPHAAEVDRLAVDWLRRHLGC
jgi:predicted esterase